MFIERVMNCMDKLLYSNSYSSESCIKYLKKKRVLIGERIRFIAPKSVISMKDELNILQLGQIAV